MPSLTPYEPNNMFWGDALSLKEDTTMNHPFLVFVRELKEDLPSNFDNNDGRGVFCDVVMLASNLIKINVCWRSSAIVDALKRYVGQVTAIKLVPTKGSNGNYPKVFPLVDNDLAYAEAWLRNNPNVVDMERAKREAEEMPGAHEATATAAPTLPTVSQQQVLPPANSAPAAPPATPAPTLPQTPAAPAAAAPAAAMPEGLNPEQQAQLAALLASYGTKQQ